MKRKYLLVLLVTLACLVAGLLLVLTLGGRKEKTKVSATAPQQPIAAISPRPESPEQARAVAAKVVEAIYTAPIAFYGKVVDQYGQPVANAGIDFGAIDEFWENGSNYHGQSDQNGFFSIKGILGAGLTVGVNKEGYDGIKGKSYQAFGYGMGVDETRQKPPTKDAPALFVLRKKALAEPLIVISRPQYDLNRNGSPIGIHLETGETGTSGMDVVEVSCLTHEELKDARGRFDWTFGISVPGGGLVERQDETQFTAPEEGYSPQEQIQMNINDPSRRWSSVMENRYFIKFADGRYARVSVSAYAGGRSFVVLESYLNPNPGSRNLEFDPAKQINPE